ncbi:hypothetical protein Droror1_Dr00015458 [Drosera rotundifolia]
MALRMVSVPSGIRTAEESKSTFSELHREKMHRYVVFEIDEQRLEVVVEKTGGPEESYDNFTASLPEEDCRFAVYDFEFVTSENCQKSRIFFVACNIKQAPRICIHIARRCSTAL